jgi:hypothetical protein
MTHFDDIRNTLLHARLCYDAWWLLESRHPNREQIVSVYNRYKGFFGTVHPALFATFLVKLASVFGTRNDEISLERIVGIDQLAKFPQLWKRGRLFHKYRSKVIAHRDVDITHKTFVPESGCPTYDSLRELLDDTCQLFDLAAKRQGAQGLPPFTSADDLLSLILALDQHQNAIHALQC